MSPIIEGADLSTVSTKFEPLPADSYTCSIKEVQMGTSKGGHPQVVVVAKVEGGDYDGRELREWLVLRQNDGKPNEISLKQLKRYFEAVLGEEAANQSNPNTDDLVNGKVTLVVDIENDNKGEPRNRIKRVLAA